jgi:hypothetical protein
MSLADVKPWIELAVSVGTLAPGVAAYSQSQLDRRQGQARLEVTSESITAAATTASPKTTAPAISVMVAGYDHAAAFVAGVIENSWAAEVGRESPLDTRCPSI